MFARTRPSKEHGPLKQTSSGKARNRRKAHFEAIGRKKIRECNGVPKREVLTRGEQLLKKKVVRSPNPGVVEGK